MGLKINKLKLRMDQFKMKSVLEMNKYVMTANTVFKNGKNFELNRLIWN